MQRDIYEVVVDTADYRDGDDWQSVVLTKAHSAWHAAHNVAALYLGVTRGTLDERWQNVWRHDDHRQTGRVSHIIVRHISA